MCVMYSEAGNKSILSIDSYHLKVVGSLHFVVSWLFVEKKWSKINIISAVVKTCTCRWARGCQNISIRGSWQRRTSSWRLLTCWTMTCAACNSSAATPPQRPHHQHAGHSRWAAWNIWTVPCWTRWRSWRSHWGCVWACLCRSRCWPCHCPAPSCPLYLSGPHCVHHHHHLLHVFLAENWNWAPSPR